MAHKITNDKPDPIGIQLMPGCSACDSACMGGCLNGCDGCCAGCSSCTGTNKAIIQKIKKREDN